MCAKNTTTPYSNPKRRIGRPSRDISQLVSFIRKDWIEPNPPGFRLPGVRRLSKKYNVDHGRIEAAFDQLVLAGLLVRRKSSGTYVSEPQEFKFQSLKGKQLGVCFPEGIKSLTSAHNGLILVGATTVLEKTGLDLFISTKPWKSKTGLQKTEQFDSPDIRAVLTVGPLEPEICNKLKSLNKPIAAVDFDASSSGIRSFCFDNHHAGKFLAKRAVMLGHDRIAAVIESLSRRPEKLDPDWTERRNGFLLGLKEKKVPDPYLVQLKFRSDYSSCSKQIRKLLQLPEDQRPTIIFTPQGHHLRMIQKIAENMALHVPNDLALVSCDGINPTIEHSGIQLDGERLGTLAGKYLLEQLTRPKPTKSSTLTRVKGIYFAGATHGRAP